jgi:hypothetical protein
MTHEKLVTERELGTRLNLPRAWIKREAQAGRLPCIRVSRRRMFDVAAVLRALANQTAKGVARG